MKRLMSGALGLVLAVCVCAPARGAAQSGAVRKRQEPKSAEPDSKQDDAPPEGNQPDGNKVYPGKEVTKRAVILAKPEPKYPPHARRSNVQGEVALRIILAADGVVAEKVEVIRGLPEGVTEAAIEAARKIKFIPAEKDGRPVSQYVTVMYHFRLY